MYIQFSEGIDSQINNASRNLLEGELPIAEIRLKVVLTISNLAGDENPLLEKFYGW